MDPFELTNSQKIVKIGRQHVAVTVENISFARLGDNVIKISEEFGGIFDRIIAAILTKYSADPAKTKFSLKITHPSLAATIGGIYLNYRTIDRINGEMIMNLLTRYQNSDYALNVDENFRMELHLLNHGFNQATVDQLSKEETANSQFNRHVV